MHLLLKRINIDAAVEEVLLVAEGSILPYMRTGLERSFEEEKRHRAEVIASLEQAVSALTRVLEEWPPF
eukprot:scaffold325040_cov61-Tisochrysis_lutea.AAC.1